MTRLLPTKDVGNRRARGLEFDQQILYEYSVFCIDTQKARRMYSINWCTVCLITVSADETLTKLTRFLKALDLAFRNDVCVKPRWQRQSPSITLDISLEFTSQTSSSRQEVWRKTNVLLKHMRRTRNTSIRYSKYLKYPGIPITVLFCVSDHDSHTFRCSSAPTGQTSFPVRGSENPLRV